ELACELGRAHLALASLQPFLRGDGRLRAVGNAEPLENRGQLVLDGISCEAELIGDLLVLRAAREELEDPVLLRAHRIDRRTLLVHAGVSVERQSADQLRR